uniref:Uncharacterized protein n=1 Tax=Solanum lycopersicum TaxID=4081 RepID=A0A3Q7GUG8_SOLLC
MVSPNGEVTNIMIKAMNQPDELNRRFTPNPDEEAHKEKLTELQKILSEAKEKRRSYEPQVENINKWKKVMHIRSILWVLWNGFNDLKLQGSVIGHQTTSEKLLYGSQPGLSHLAKNLTRHVKLMARSRPTFFVRRHVIFRKDAFPFANESGSNYHPIFVDTVHGSGGYHMNVIEQQEHKVTEQQKLEVTNSFNQAIENVVPHIVTDKVDHVVEFAVPGPTKMSTRNTQTPTWVRNIISLNITKDISPPKRVYFT